MGYDWDFSGILYYLPAFKRAILVTIELAILSSVLGTILGIPIAVLLRLKGARFPLSILIDILRAIPNLVLIFFFYYFPYKQLLNVEPLSPFNSALYALITAQAAYSADAFRTALDQIPRSQILGVKALGYKDYHIKQYVVLPSLVKQTLPVHVALWIGNLKLTSLASVIGVQDVVFVAKVSMVQNYRSLESWLFVAIIYAILVLPTTYLLRILERSAWVKRQ